MRNKLLLTLLLFFGLFSSLNSTSLASEDTCSTSVPCDVSGEEEGGADKNSFRPSNEEKLCVFHFWGAGCSACASIDNYIHDLLEEKKDKVEFQSLEIYYDEENRALFDDFNKRYGVEKPGVPAVFVGDTYLGGPKSIKDNLAEKIDYFYENRTDCPLDINKVEGEIEEPKKLELTLPAILLGALADSINPCAFAVLTLLLVYLLTIQEKKKILTVGTVYISVVFIVYFISGLGLLKLARYIQVTHWLLKIIASITIVTGVINIKDYFWYGKGISLRIPESKKPLIEKYIKKATIPGAIILGFLVAAFELPCTGGIYLAILGLLAKKALSLNTILYLLVYNFIFVLPLWIILIVIYKGYDPEKFNSWRLEKRKWLRLIMGIVMLILGIGLFVGVF